MDPKQPLGPPELPKNAKVPGLIQSTQSLPSAQNESTPTEEPDEPDALNEHVESPGDPDGLVAAEERRKWMAEHTATEAAPQPKPRRKRRWPVWVLVLVVVAAAAAGVYWFGNKQASKNTSTDTKLSGTAKQSGGATTQTPKTDDMPSVPTKHYDSTNYTLGIDYPENWKVSDTATKLTIASPSVALPSADGTTVNGHVVLTIQKQQGSIAGYPSGGATAVLLSKKLSYKQPTSVQRAQTYLSYLSYGKVDGLNALYITGDNGYQQGQLVPQNDVIRADPLIGAVFESCTSDDCATGTPTPLTLMASKWDGLGMGKQLTAVFESLTLN
jgi:hypothetical protein